MPPTCWRSSRPRRMGWTSSIGVTIGAKAYQNVIFFEHATLAVSPIVNALELGRFFANSTGGKIDVIAHSRGGLVVAGGLKGSVSRCNSANRQRRFAPSLPARRSTGPRSPLPTSSRTSMSLLTNIGSFAEITLKLAGAANPFLWVGGKLVEVVVSVTGALANTPLVDGLVALVSRTLRAIGGQQQPRDRSASARALRRRSHVLCDPIEL